MSVNCGEKVKLTLIFVGGCWQQCANVFIMCRQSPDPIRRMFSSPTTQCDSTYQKLKQWQILLYLSES